MSEKHIVHPQLFGFLRDYAESLPRKNSDYRSAHERLGFASEDYVEEALLNLRHAEHITSFRRAKRFSLMDLQKVDFIVNHPDNRQDFLQITTSSDTAWKKEGIILQMKRMERKIFVIPVFDCYDDLVPLSIIEQSIMAWHLHPEEARRNLWDYLNQPTDIQSITNFGGKHRT